MMRALYLSDRAAEAAPTRLESAALEQIGRPEPGGLCWIDLSGQTQAEIEHLGRAFGFHALALEDCLAFDQRPKLEEYPGAEPYLFVVIHNFQQIARATQPDDLNAGGFVVRPQELHAFLGKGFLVTVHEQPLPALDAVWQRLAAEPELLRRGCDFVYYLVADALCDSNFPVIEQISDSLDELEEAVLDQPTKEHLNQTYRLRKVLVRMRKVLSPQRDVLGLLTRLAGNPCVSAQNAAYFRDVYDHLVRIGESIESGRDLLGNCVDAYLSSVGQRTNEIMKRLTILSALMLPLSFLSGFFGMNFEMLPFKSYAAFAAALLLMFVITPAGMLLWFRARGWI